MMQGYNPYFDRIASIPACIISSGSFPIDAYIPGDNSAEEADSIAFRSFPSCGNFAANLIASLYCLLFINSLSVSNFVIPICMRVEYIGLTRL